MACSGCSAHAKAPLNFQNLPISIWGQHQTITPLQSTPTVPSTPPIVTLPLPNPIRGIPGTPGLELPEGGFFLGEPQFAEWGYPFSPHPPGSILNPNYPQVGDPDFNGIFDIYHPGDVSPISPFVPKPFTPGETPGGAFNLNPDGSISFSDGTIIKPPDTSFWDGVLQAEQLAVTALLSILTLQGQCRNNLTQLNRINGLYNNAIGRIKNKIHNGINSAGQHGATSACINAYTICVQDILDKIDAIDKQIQDIIKSIQGSLPGEVPAVAGQDCESINPVTLTTNVIASSNAILAIKTLGQQIVDLEKSIKDCDRLLTDCNKKPPKVIPILATRPIGETTKKILNILTSVKNDIVPPDGDHP